MTTPTSAPSNEELLRTIIEAQVKGGCGYFETALDSLEKIEDRGYCEGAKCHILEILLDTEGCKAAFGIVEDRYDVPDKLSTITACITEAWHSQIGESKKGNNVRKALEVAVALLLESK